MKISVSQLKRHVECPMKAHYEYTLLRGVAHRPLALDVGVAAHLALEAKLKGEPWEKAVDDFLLAIPFEYIEEATEAVNGLIPAIRMWTPEADWEIVSV